jgi:hypothetical protein
MQVIHIAVDVWVVLVMKPSCICQCPPIGVAGFAPIMPCMITVQSYGVDVALPLCGACNAGSCEQQLHSELRLHCVAAVVHLPRLH